MKKIRALALLALLLPLVLPAGAVRADDIQPLVPREAILDTAPSTSASTSTAPSSAVDPDASSASRTLSGAVSRTDTLPAAPNSNKGNETGDGKIDTDVSPGQLKMLIDMLRSARKMAGGYNVIINGKTVEHGDINFGSRRPTMSSDDFRKLEHGVIGLNAVVHLDSGYPIVTSVLPTCPAAIGGIRPGDLLIKANDHVFQLGDGQAVLWKVVGGRAGTPVDITVLREGQELTFHLVRMNIEDIRDDRIRNNYEMLLSMLGAPGE